jgi:hypothetical protein
MLKVINGTAIAFDDGVIVAVEFQESFPYTSLNCFMADECNDYEEGEITGTCDYKNCQNAATTKGFVVLRGLNQDGTTQTADMYACEKHKNKDGFFEYVEADVKLIKGEWE